MTTAGAGDTFAVPELLTGLVTADTEDLVGLGGGLVSGLVRSSGSQFWMRSSTTTLANYVHDGCHGLLLGPQQGPRHRAVNETSRIQSRCSLTCP